jgi:hypothetical protein
VPTFVAVFDRIVPADGKYMATLFNGASGRKVVVHKIWAYNWQVVAANNGAVLQQSLFRISARTVGVAVTPDADDTNDTLTAGITADYDTTAVTESTRRARIILTNKEVGLGAVDPVTARTYARNSIVYERSGGTRGLTLRAGQGCTIKNETANTAGSVSYVFEFTDESE